MRIPLEEQGFELSDKQRAIAIIKKALPLSLLSGCDVISQFIRIYLISRFGNDALTSTTICFSITNFIVLPIPLLTSQDAIFIANKYGKIKISPSNVTSSMEEQNEVSRREAQEDITALYLEIGSFVRQGWLLALSFSVPTTGLLIVLTPYLVRLFNQTPEVESLAQNYLLPFAFSIPFQYLLTINERFISGVDLEKWLIPYRLLTFTVELALNYWLIDLYSVAGSAYAQLGKTLLAFLSLSIIFCIKKEFQKFKIYSRGLGDITYIKKILSEGWPMCFSLFLTITNAYILSIFTGSLGSGRLAVEQTIAQYFGVATVLNNLGISESANRIASQYFGAKKYREMQRTTTLSLKLNILIYSIISIFYNIFPIQLAFLFLGDDSNNPSNINSLIRYNFIIMTIANLAGIIQENCRTSLTAINDTALASGTFTIVNFALVLPSTALATYVFKLDLYGITGSVTLGTLTSMVVIYRYWLKHTNEIIKTKNTDTKTSNEKLSDFFRTKCFRRNNYRSLEESAPSSFSPRSSVIVP